MSARYEWRVTWRRIGWRATSDSKSRVFARRHDARRFLAKLLGDDRPDLSQVEVHVSRREVGPWEIFATYDAEGYGVLNAGERL